MYCRFLALLCLLVLSHSQPTVVTDPTVLASYALTCSQAPVSNLALCNNTCQTCGSSSYMCATCPTQFSLSNQICSVDNNIHSYKAYRYLNALNLQLMAADIAKFTYADTGVALNVSKVVEVCKANSFEIFMAGLFQVTETVGLTYNYEEKIDQIQIKFNFMAVISSVTLFIDINGENYYTNQFSIFSDLSGNYGVDNNLTSPNYLLLDALSTSNVGSVIDEVDTGVMSLIAKNVEIQIYIKSQEASNTFSWGFNDVLVVTRSCETCVTDAVQALMDKLLLFTWAVAIVVAVLIVLLFAFIKIEDIKRKMDFQDKLGASSDNLPLKAMNRVMDSLQKSIRTMEKEFKKEDKRFMKLMKKA